MYQITSRLARSFLLFISFSAFQSVLIAADPDIISKSQWNGAETANEPTRQSLPVGRVIILHTAGVECQNVNSCSQQVRNIQNYHLKSFHFDEIAYNFLIGNDGNVYEGRGWEFVGAAVRNYNVGGLSVAFIGTFESNAPSKEALEAAQALLDLGVRTSKLTENYKLFGHRQLSPTSSPGAALYEIIKQWPHWSRNIS